MAQESLIRMQGGIPLKGSVNISGSKHTALAILGVLPLIHGNIKLVNLPEISDVQHMLNINESLGVSTVRLGKNEYVFSVEEINYSEEEMWRVSELRSSVLYLGSILLSCGHVLLPIPGGDKLGIRPLNEFLYVLDAFSVQHDLQNEGVRAYFDGLEGDRELDLCPKMFALMGNNRSALALMLAYANKGTTKMKNVLIVPEIVHLCQFLQLISQGVVSIEGIGTNIITVISPGLETIRQGKCNQLEFVIGPDKCEIPFWICASALTKGDITCRVSGNEPIANLLAKMNEALLQKAGIPLEVIGSNQFRINCDSKDYRPKAFHLISTYKNELDGIALDACPILATLLFKAKGDGSFCCPRYGFERIRWAKQLSNIGAIVHIRKNVLFTEGCEILSAKDSFILEGDDIRSASSVLLLALATEGKPLFVRGIRNIKRGMEDTIAKLQSVGALIDVPQEETLTK